MVYTHALNRGGRGVRSPLDNLRQAVANESGGIYPDQPVGLRPGGELGNTTEVIANNLVAAQGWGRQFSSPADQAGFYPGQPKQELDGPG